MECVSCSFSFVFFSLPGCVAACCGPLFWVALVVVGVVPGVFLAGVCGSFSFVFSPVCRCFFPGLFVAAGAFGVRSLLVVLALPCLRWLCCFCWLAFSLAGGFSLLRFPRLLVFSLVCNAFTGKKKKGSS